MLFKGCPRCGGDMFVEQELGYKDLVCLQCSYRRTVSSDMFGSYLEHRRRYDQMMERQPDEAEKAPV